MGFGHVSSGTLAGYDTLMRGYPLCSTNQPWSASIPANCTPNALYGDIYCDLSQWGPACRSDGWACTMDASCDGSPGQSGSSIYTYDTTFAPGIPISVGVYSFYECIGTGCAGNHYPNGYTRITPDISSMLSYYLSLWD